MHYLYINVGHTLLLCVYALQGTSIARRILVALNRLPQATIHPIKHPYRTPKKEKANIRIFQIREAVQKNPKQRTPPTHPKGLGRPT